MSDGDIFKVEDSLYLQLGELQESSEAPFAVFIRNTSEQTRYCDPILPRYYIPKGEIDGISDDYYYINLASEAIPLLPLDTFSQIPCIAELSYTYMNVITKCALTRGTIKQNIKPYLRVDRT